MARPPRLVEPMAGEPAATVDLGNETALLIADYHAGIEEGLRYERGVELPSNAEHRRQRLLALLSETNADRLVVLGDLGHYIGETEGVEREELDALYEAVVVNRGIEMTIAPGNHDGELAELFGDRDGVTILPASGGLLGEPPATLGVVHGHTWPNPELLSATTICMGHEHPQVKLEDSVGGYRVEQAWLRGRVDPAAMMEKDDSEPPGDAGDPPELVVFPAFNDRSGGTWVNVDGQGFLAPFLPAGIPDAECYLLDGTRLGPFRDV
ncbi:metallophosphoesterase [Halonotius terrestris]|uniref:Metallophosphoesterase n=1 Tax=Halonotius terrestris TaxID=2487750 RepID=A0A8J8PCS1_9EURY|nr:metallophosphoesterase [Halonotius terrestris]TQQ82807.1 metallophosphoesterase [Halonotius terrestris]